MNTNNPSKTRKIGIVAIKFIFSFVLFGIIFYQIDWGQFISILDDIERPIIGFYAFLLCINIAISSIKWKILLSAHMIDLNLGKLIRYYFTSLFFGKFLPSTIGGDGYRVYKIYRYSQSKSSAIMPVFIERLTGIITLILIGFGAGIMTYWHSQDKISFAGIVISATLSSICIILTFFLFSEKSSEFLNRIPKMPNFLKKVIKQLVFYQTRKKKLILCFLFSIFFYIIQIAGRMILLYATDVECPIYVFTFVMMLSTIVAQIPLSLNGLGLMDGSFIYLIGNYGVPAENSFTVMVLVRTITLAVSSIGILFFIKSEDKMHGTKAIKDQIRSIK